MASNCYGMANTEVKGYLKWQEPENLKSKQL